MEAFLSGGHILLALLGFAFVIFIHELGHFAFAKWAGVRVEVFSIGFGPIIWSRTIGETRYALSLLPLGGYVRMLGQEDLPGHAGEEDDHPASYQSKHPGWKAAILFGGVLFNFISSWLILVALAFYGMPHFPPVVGEVVPTVRTMVDGDPRDVPSPAALLGIQRGDRILSVNGERVRDFEDIIFATLSTGVETITLTIERDGQTITLPPEGAPAVRPVYSINEGKVALGIALQRSTTVAHSLAHGDHQALNSGWEVVSLNGEAVGEISGQDLDNRLQPFAGQDITLGLQGRGAPDSITMRYAGSSMDASGLFGLPVTVRAVVTDSAAEEAGVLAGDVLLAINDQPLAGIHDLRARIAASDGAAVRLQLLRPAGSEWTTVERVFKPRWDAVNQQFLIGIHMGTMGSGRLPDTLPPALGGLPSPLENAGVEPGSVLVDSRIDQAERMVVRVLPPATTSQLVPLSESAWQALDRYRTVALISKLAGFRDTPARSQQLLGARITASGPGQSGHPKPGWLTVEGYADGQALHEFALDLNDLPAADRQALLAIDTGAYVVSTSSFSADGQRALKIAIPPPSVLPQSHRLAPAPVGTVIAFGIEERPYELASFGEAFTLANDKSMQMIGKTLALIPRFFQPGSEGGISAEKSLHGPIGIFSELQARLQHLGFPSFLRLVALIGLNLFLINLLPIPITDGGQLVILGVEVGIRRPIPPLILNIINSIGFALIVTLMLFVVGIDIARKIFGY